MTPAASVGGDDRMRLFLALQLPEANVDDAPQVELAERAKDDHVVQAVQELGPKELTQTLEQQVAQSLASVFGFEQLGVGV